MHTEEAIRAAEKAYAPYSRFKVGAIIEDTNGKLYEGCNVENASYGLTICAERTAAVKAVYEGSVRFKSVTVHADTASFCWPCGACRQFLHEFGPDMEVVSVTKDGKSCMMKLSELFPNGFGPSSLDAGSCMTAGRGRRRQMDFQNRVGGKTGSGGLLNESEINQARRDRLRKLALETIDLTKDPYFMKNHLGTYECRLCLTLHNNEGSYLSHTQGKKHQANLSRRAAKEAALNPTNLQPNLPKMETQRPSMMKIGRPGYKAMKVRDPLTKYPGVLFQIHYPNLGSTAEPRYRIMSAFEQRIEQPNKNYQYLVVAAEPYESIGFKIPNKELDNSEARIFSYWDVDSGIFTVQVMFRSDD